METSKYRKVSELEKVYPFRFVLCYQCREIFFNDTLNDSVRCPKHPESLMENFVTEERAERQLARINSGSYNKPNEFEESEAVTIASNY